ncbi:MAG: helix-turn-helix domain-containing protein [Bacteroidetes bacterium]|nr:helix-turn-helix domain-containing protein [Bacteroidota bacterium]
MKTKFEPIEKQLLTMEEAANLLKVSRNTFMKRFVETKEIRVVFLDEHQDHFLFWIRDIEDLISKKAKYWTPEAARIWIKRHKTILQDDPEPAGM